jgi:hypothetical protein
VQAKSNRGAMLDFNFITSKVLLIREWDEDVKSNKKSQEYLVIATETGMLAFEAKRR